MKLLPKRLFVALVPSVAAVVLAAPVLAQDAGLVSPQPLQQDGRFMPGVGNEAIVKARFTVKADGTTDDVEIISYLSNRALDTQLHDTVSAWTFEPGTANGEAVDFHNQEWVFALRVDPNAPPPAPEQRGRRGAAAQEAASAEATAAVVEAGNGEPIPLALSSEVKTAVDEISALVAANDLNKALREADKLLRDDIHTVFDYSLAQELRASILMAQEQPFAALEASGLSTLYAYNPQGGVEYFLTDEILAGALRKKFLLAASVSQNALAWDTYQTMQSQLELAADDQIHQQAQAAKAKLDSPEPLGMIAKITADKQWTHKPSRRIFTVADVDGKLDRINARCQRRSFVLEYQEDVDWTLPASFGSCELDFVGRNGTQFTVYEFLE